MFSLCVLLVEMVHSHISLHKVPFNQNLMAVQRFKLTETVTTLLQTIAVNVIQNLFRISNSYH